MSIMDKVNKMNKFIKRLHLKLNGKRIKVTQSKGDTTIIFSMEFPPSFDENEIQKFYTALGKMNEDVSKHLDAHSKEFFSVKEIK